MDDPLLIAAILGYAGVAVNLLWPVLRSRTAMLAAQALGAVFFAIHYGLLGALTAAVLLGMAALQALAAIPLGTRPRFRLIYLATIPVIAAIMASSWQGLPSLFASLGLATISVGRYQTDLIRFRAFLVACIPFWTVHNLMVWSVPGLVSDALSFASGLWMLLVTIQEARLAAETVRSPAL